MAQNYIGKTPVTGDFKKCDSITTADNTATYNLRVGSVAVYPESALHCIVQVNGIQQVGKTDYNIVNDTIVFTSNLMAADTINQVLILGNINDIGVPSSDSVGSSHIKNDAVDSQHYAAGSIDLEHMSSESVDEDNLHISNAGTNGQFLSKSSNTGGLTWADAGGAADDYFASSGLSAKDLGVGLHIKTADSGADVAGAVDELVVEASGHGGMSILTGTSSTGAINFGDSGDNDAGRIEYAHNNNSLTLSTGGYSRWVVDSSGHIQTGRHTDDDTGTFAGDQGQFSINGTGVILTCQTSQSSGTLWHGVNTNGSTSSWIKEDGSGYMPNGWSTSDRNGKNIIGSVSHGLDKLKQVEAKEFTWKKSNLDKDNNLTFTDENLDDNKHYGVIAQELQSVLPDIVHDKEPTLRVDYNALLMVAINSIKELSTKNDALEARIKTLEDA